MLKPNIIPELTAYSTSGHKLEITPLVTISWEHESYEWCTLDQLLASDDFKGFYREGIEYASKHNIFTT